MYAVIKIGGKQYKVREGELIRTEKIKNVNPGDEIELTEVIALAKDDGNLVLGKPFVENAKVKLKKIEAGRGKKVIVFKFKRKKRYRRKYGHRQWYSLFKVEKIEWK